MGFLSGLDASPAIALWACGIANRSLCSVTPERHYAHDLMTVVHCGPGRQGSVGKWAPVSQPYLHKPEAYSIEGVAECFRGLSGMSEMCLLGHFNL